jgi:alkanesulfonate monooxygenase SsuD/methylene tetrahydromethanopterin reductase-like flavin-dependent oxidoreductase (luciferase family)
MEFGLFNQMYHPVHRRAERTEYDVLREELALIEVADRVGFKYAWASEHHFLDEYSHLSASEAFMAFALARTKNIHIGSGIINITPNVSPPSRVAEKVAMLDHLGQGRFEWGTGRGSSSTEVFGFNIDSMDVTREMYDETLPEIIKMMRAGEYGPYEGKHFTMPRRNVLPKPYTNPHPPIWVAAGSPGTFEKAARLGLGVLCFTLGTPDTLAPMIELYKKTIEKAEPVLMHPADDPGSDTRVGSYDLRLEVSFLRGQKGHILNVVHKGWPLYAHQVLQHSTARTWLIFAFGV